MPFIRYTSTNEARGQLLTTIGASTLSLVVKTGQGSLFPTTFPFKLKIEKYDTTGATIKREIVKCTTRTGDTFTIIRSHEACPSSDIAITQTTTAFAFDADDYVFHVHTADAKTDQDNEITRLENEKLNLGSLRTGLATAWRFFFSNGSNAETGLAFGTSGTVLTSNGATSSPTFETPTVSIVGLTEDTTGSLIADFLVKNNGTGVNTKIKPDKYAELTIGKLITTGFINISTTSGTSTIFTATKTGFINFHVAATHQDNQIGGVTTLIEYSTNGGSSYSTIKSVTNNSTGGGGTVTTVEYYGVFFFQTGTKIRTTVTITSSGSGKGEFDYSL